MTGEYSLKFYENLKISQKHSHNERFQAFPFNYIRHKFYISSHVKQDQVSFTPLFFSILLYRMLPSTNYKALIGGQ